MTAKLGVTTVDGTGNQPGESDGGTQPPRATVFSSVPGPRSGRRDDYRDEPTEVTAVAFNGAVPVVPIGIP